MVKTEYEQIVEAATAPLLAESRTMAILAGKLCNFHYELSERMAKRARKPKFTIIDPPKGEGDFEHRLIVPFDKLDDYRLELIRVVPRPKARDALLKPRLAVRLDSCDTIEAHPRYKDFGPDVARFLAIVERFIADPDAAFAASGSHCVFCGRPLTDEASRLRGIGPDCFEEYGDLMKYLRPTHPVA